MGSEAQPVTPEAQPPRTIRDLSYLSWELPGNLQGCLPPTEREPAQRRPRKQAEPASTWVGRALWKVHLGRHMYPKNLERCTSLGT